MEIDEQRALERQVAEDLAARKAAVKLKRQASAAKARSVVTARRAARELAKRAAWLREAGVEVTAAAVDSVRRVGDLLIPSWWPAFGESNHREDVRWVYEEFAAIMGEKQLRLEKASRGAPSKAALGVAMNAWGNRNKFYDVTVPKILDGVDDGEESEEEKREKTKIEDIRAILRELRDE